MVLIGTFLLGCLLGTRAASSLNDSGDDPDAANCTWRATDNPYQGGGGAPSHAPAGPVQWMQANPQPVQYGRPPSQAVYAARHEADDRPIPGFRQMFMLPDGGVFSPTVNPPHTPIEWLCRGEWFYGIMDTGASRCVLSHDDARRMGINPRRLRYDGAVRTATGRAGVAEVTIPEMSIGPIRLTNVAAHVMQECPHDGSLVGQSFLRQLSSVRLIEEGVLLYR